VTKFWSDQVLSDEVIFLTTGKLNSRLIEFLFWKFGNLQQMLKIETLDPRRTHERMDPHIDEGT